MSKKTNASDVSLAKCERCNDQTFDEGSRPILCSGCTVELQHKIMAAHPDPVFKHCAICGAPYSFTEARVLRKAKTPRAGDPATPELCWVCARLRHSVLMEPPAFDMPVNF
jgi:hypothetical protein